MLQKSNTQTAVSNHPLIDDYARGRIEYRVIHLSKTFHLDEPDKDDLRQDMMIELLKAGDRFDSAIAGQKTFINRVLDTFYQRYLRRRRQRSRHNVFQPIGYDDVAVGFIPERTNESETSEQERTELRLDIETILQQMPPRLKDICTNLMEYSPSETAKRLNISPSTVTRSVPRIREYFVAAGFDHTF